MTNRSNKLENALENWKPGLEGCKFTNFSNEFDDLIYFCARIDPDQLRTETSNTAWNEQSRSARKCVKVSVKFFRNTDKTRTDVKHLANHWHLMVSDDEDDRNDVRSAKLKIDFKIFKHDKIAETWASEKIFCQIKIC